MVILKMHLIYYTYSTEECLKSQYCDAIIVSDGNFVPNSKLTTKYRKKQ